MKRGMMSRLNTGIMAFALVLTQILMPVQMAYATNSNVTVSGGRNSESDRGTDKPVWCQITGQGFKAVLGNENSDNSNRSPLTQLPEGHGIEIYIRNGQVQAPNRSDNALKQLLNEYCASQYTVDTDIVVDLIVNCGQGNDGIELPTVTGVSFTQSEWVEGELTVTATLAAGYVWSDESSAPRQIVLTDTGTLCPPEDEEAMLPVPSQVDPCGLDNASWSTQINSDEYNWSLINGELIVTAADGYYFVLDDEIVSSVNFGFATDNEELCPSVVPCAVSTGMEIVTTKEQFADFAYQDTRSKGHSEFQSNGLRIYTDDNSSQAKVAWYKDVVDYSLAQIGEPSIDYTSTTGIKPGMQIVLDKDGNGSSDGIIVGEPDFYGNNWWSNSNFGVGNGMGYASYGTLTQYLVANPNAKVMAVGFSLGSGVLADGLLKSVTFGCYTWTFKKAPRVPTECTVRDNLYIQPWTFDGYQYPEAGDAGTFKFNKDGLYVSTPEQDSYVYGLIDAGNTPILDIDDMSYMTYRDASSTGNSQTVAAYVLYVDLDGNLATDDGTYLFYEPANNGPVQTGVWQTWDVDADDAKFWSFELSDGNPSLTWEQIVATYPNGVAQAYGFNQGTYNQGANTRIQSIVFDCAETVFGAPGRGGENPTIPTTPTVPTVPVVPVIPVVATPVVPAAGQGNLLPEELPLTGENGLILFTWIALLAAILTYGSVYYLQPKKRFEQ